MRVLVVEDEEALADAIARGLRREGMAVDVAGDGGAALEKAATNGYDVVILDRDLPVVHGDDVCRSLIASAPAPGAAEIPRILMLTASGDLDDRVEGLMLGADDYLGKPFAFAELVARIRALSRRGSLAVKPVLEVGDVVLDPARHYVTRGGHPLPVTRKEMAVLEVLIRAGGAVVSPEQLLERVWDEHADPFTNTIRVTVMNLRRKLGDPPVIETVVGSGYRIVSGGEPPVPPVSSGDTPVPPVSSGDTPVPPVSSGDTPVPPVSSGDTPVPPVSSGGTPVPPGKR